MDHEKYMRRCLELALSAKWRGKTAVGALLVKNGQIISDESKVTVNCLLYFSMQK